jgi:signal peptidase II
MNLSENFSTTKILFRKKNLYIFVIILLIFLLDRVSKIMILENFSDNSYYINSFVNISLTWNSGIGFGLLSFNTSLIYNSITAVIGFVIIVLIYITLKSSNFERIIYSVIIGGAIGNIYDRLTYKAVPDFIDIHYNNFHWFTFNVADIFITIGIIGMLAKEFFKKN